MAEWFWCALFFSYSFSGSVLCMSWLDCIDWRKNQSGLKISATAVVDVKVSLGWCPFFQLWNRVHSNPIDCARLYWLASSSSILEWLFSTSLCTSLLLQHPKHFVLYVSLLRVHSKIGCWSKQDTKGSVWRVRCWQHKDVFDRTIQGVQHRTKQCLFTPYFHWAMD